MIFHAVLGKDEREANSPSFFNVSEIEVLVDYLDKLMETQGKKGLPKLSPKDIGIIAPYRKQVNLHLHDRHPCFRCGLKNSAVAKLYFLNRWRKSRKP